MIRTTLLSLLTLLLPAATALAQEDPRAAAPDTAPAAAAAPENVVEKTSYGLGLRMGRNFKYQEFEVDLDLMVQGLKDGLAGAQPKYGDEEVEAAIQASRAAAAKAIGARNRALGEAFLTANALKQGVFTLPSGLQYEILQEGVGPRPTAEDRVVVKYRTALVDGTVVEDTFGDEEPQTVPVSTLIPGWAEALQLMPTGARWRLYVPPDLAHGDRGSGAIGPGATAVFVIELVEIAPPEPDSQAGEPAESQGSE